MSIAPVGLVFWLDTQGAEVSVSDLVAQIAALTELAAELDRRLAEGGVGGIEAVVALYQRMRTVLEGVTVADIEHMMAQVAHLQGELAAIDRRLAALRDLKTMLDRVDATR